MKRRTLRWALQATLLCAVTGIALYTLLDSERHETVDPKGEAASPAIALAPTEDGGAATEHFVLASPLPEFGDAGSDDDEEEFEDEDQPSCTGEFGIEVFERGRAAGGLRVVLSTEGDETTDTYDFVSDAQGRIRATLPCDSYETWILADGASEIRHLLDVSDEEVATLRLELERGFEVEFQILDAEGRPRPEADIFISRTILKDDEIDEERSVDFELPAAHGRRIRLAEGPYTFTASEERYAIQTHEVDVGPGTPRRLGFTLVPIASTLELLVLCGGAPCPGVRVEAWHGDDMHSGLSAPDGRLRLNLPSAEIQVHGRKDEFSEDALEGTLALRLHPEETRSETLRMERTGGDAVLTGTVAAPDGGPSHGASVSITCGKHRRHARTGPDGTFRITGLPRGECEVSLVFSRVGRSRKGTMMGSSEFIATEKVSAPGEVRFTHKYPLP